MRRAFLGGLFGRVAAGPFLVGLFIASLFIASLIVAGRFLAFERPAR